MRLSFRHSRPSRPHLPGGTARFAAVLLLAWLAAAHAAPERLPDAALAQIGALQAEKSGRTLAQRKMDSQLVHAAKRLRREALGAGLDHLRSGVRVDPDGRVLVDVAADVTPGLLARLEIGRAHV